MQFLGTLINTGAIIIGGILGLILSRQFEKNARLREVPSAAMKAISVVVIVIGVEGAIESTKPIVLLLSMVIGTVIGTIINIDGALEKFGKNMERKFIKSNKSVHPELAKDLPQKSFSKAFISATLTCCVGALAITGALESGLSGGSEQGLLYTKSVLDFTTALVFSASYGGGAILACVPVLIYQGLIELCASGLQGFLAGSIVEISAVGSLIVCALGLNMLGATKIKIANMLPSVLVPILLCLFL